MDHGRGSGAALPQSVLDPSQRPVTGAVGGVMTWRPASIGAAIVRKPEDDGVIIETRVFERLCNVSDSIIHRCDHTEVRLSVFILIDKESFIRRPDPDIPPHLHKGLCKPPEPREVHAQLGRAHTKTAASPSRAR